MIVHPRDIFGVLISHRIEQIAQIEKFKKSSREGEKKG